MPNISKDSLEKDRVMKKSGEVHQNYIKSQLFSISSLNSSIIELVKMLRAGHLRYVYERSKQKHRNQARNKSQGNDISEVLLLLRWGLPAQARSRD